MTSRNRSDRRRFLATTAAGLAMYPVCSLAEALKRTPGEALGPYYPVAQRLPHTHDMTHPAGAKGTATGELLHISGRVLARDGRPVPLARIEIWQANAAGRYNHPSDRSGLALDENFQGAAEFETDAEGRYAFRTVKPGPYPGEHGMRTRHIHYQVTGRYDRLVTQAYFPGEPLNATDFFLSHETRPQDLMLRFAQAVPGGAAHEATFDLVLGVG